MNGRDLQNSTVMFARQETKKMNSFPINQILDFGH
jgi:hypothetical protein